MGKARKNENQEAQASGAQASGEAEAKTAANQRYDVTDESANTHIYAADIGRTITSHGDGSATISPQYIERREELKKRNSPEGVNAENIAVAKKLGLIK